jgi:hypothetical protein
MSPPFRPTTLVSALILAGTFAAGCKKDTTTQEAPGGAPIAADSSDPLWALAPADLEVAMVVADGALAPLHGGALRVMADLEKAPGGAPIAAMIRKEAVIAGINALDPAALGEMGLDLTRGAAMFVAPSGKLAVVPVTDAKKFLAKVGGTSEEGGIDRIGPMICKEVSGRYLCASSPEVLEAAAGAGGASAAGGRGLIAGWPQHLRGHLEMFIAPQAFGDDLPLADPQGMRMAAVIERGGFTARVHMIGRPAGPLAAARSEKSALTAGLADKQPVGLLVLSAAGLWQQARAEAIAGAAEAPPLPGGATMVDLVSSLTGEAVGHALPGQPLRGIGRIGLSSPEPMKKLIGACAELAAAAPPGVSIEKKGERCSVRIDPTAFGEELPGLTAMSLDLWVEDDALVLGMGEHTATSAARPGLSPFARELLEGDWLIAAWGRGAMAGGPFMADKAQLDSFRAQDPTGGLVVWALHHLTEFGLAMRVADDGMHGALRVSTLWASPDEVVAAVQAKLTAFVGGDDDALAQLAELANKHPDTPFGRDMQAGAGGLVPPVAAIGMLAAISIPAFMKYKERSRALSSPDLE